MMMLLGYTMEQWAIVFARYPLRESTYAAMLECRRQWQRDNPAAPGELTFGGVEPARDWGAVERTLHLMWHVKSEAA